MSAQEIVTGVIVVGAVVWLARNLIVRARGGGCECSNASTCPYAGGPDCRLATRPTAPKTGGEADDDADK